jgi:hypothetical protein
MQSDAAISSFFLLRLLGLLWRFVMTLTMHKCVSFFIAHEVNS